MAPKRGKLILELTYMNVCKNIDILITDAIIHVSSTTDIIMRNYGNNNEITEGQIFEEYITVLLYEDAKNRKSTTNESYSVDNMFWAMIWEQKKQNNKSTLELLLNGVELDNNEKVLLKEIVEIGKSCEDLMIKHAGLIDDRNLRQGVIPQAISHFYILREAFNKNIQMDIERFRDYSFPIDLDDALEKEVIRLKRRLDILNS